MDWFKNQVVASIFVDPTCGNGQCDSPFEYMAFPHKTPPTASTQDSYREQSSSRRKLASSTRARNQAASATTILGSRTSSTIHLRDNSVHTMKATVTASALEKKAKAVFSALTDVETVQYGCAQDCGYYPLVTLVA